MVPLAIFTVGLASITVPLLSSISIYNVSSGGLVSSTIVLASQVNAIYDALAVAFGNGRLRRFLSVVKSYMEIEVPLRMIIEGAK